MAKKKPTLVQIEWRDPASDWPWFYLLKMRGEWMHLQGADYPDGSAKHVGDCIWVHKSDVRAMRSNDSGKPTHYSGFAASVVGLTNELEPLNRGTMMSGGSLDYVYSRVEDAAMQVASRAQNNLHRAFAMHLHKVAKALHDLEWMLSCDTSEGSEIAAIRAVLPEGAEIECATQRAREALADLQAALRKGDRNG